MKRNITVFSLALICTAFLLSSCTVRLGNLSSSPSAGASAAAAAESSSPPPASAPVSAPESAAPSSASTADSGLTLDGIRQAVKSAGFETAALEDYQLIDEPKPAGGFTIVYEDDYSASYIPVFEFKSPQDALSYAAIVNEEGYNLCIVNGKFLTMTGATYGIPINDNETKLLEKILQGEVMIVPEPAPVPLLPAADYGGACAQIDTIYKALDRLVNRSVLVYDKTAADDAKIAGAFVSFTLVSSGDLGFTSSLSEDQAQLDAVRQVWEMFGVTDMKIAHSKPNDYVMTGKRAGMDTSFEIHCSFDPATGSLRLLDTDGGQVLELYEYVPLGGDKYAFQTLYERAIIEYKDGKIASFIYALNIRDAEHMYSPDKDSIIGKGAGLDEAWVSAAGADSYDQFITYDGAVLKIAADTFMGDRLNAEISVR